MQGKYKVGVVSANGLGRLLLKTGGLAMSAGANAMNFSADLIVLHA
jgi:hypothetical protein